MTKIIKAVFGGRNYSVTAKRTRTDYGQVLEFIDIDLPDTFECVFSNSDTSAGVGKKQIGSNKRVLIPDEYLATGQTIYAWILLHDTEDDGRHMYSIRIPVADMPDTSPEEPTPVEQSVISQAITALNSAVTTTTQKASEAAASADRAEQAAEGVESYAERAEAAQSASEDARDIALEAKVNAQASAATASTKASEAISSASAASQSALTAESASESAQEYASASAESASASAVSASQASEHASTAGSKATEASGYASSASASAQTASQKASEASQSASTAVQAKTDAETAKTASETAQGLAETARNEAVTAKEDAESARDEAQSIVDGITGKVEQIDSNTDRIESLEDDRYKPYPTDTASGSIASFTDGADGIPLKSCIVQIEPVQAGSGDPSPDNVRPISGWTGCEVNATGENLFSYDPTKATTGISTAEATRAYYPLDVSNCTLSFSAELIDSGSVTTSNINIGKLKDGKLNVLNVFISPSRITERTYTFSKDEKAVLMTANDSVGSIINNFPKYRICVTTGPTPTPYEPYQGQTIPINWQTEAGTVYGGYIDVLNGELVVDRYFANVSSVANKSTKESGYFWYNTSGNIGIPAIKGTNAKLISNRFAMNYNVNEGSNYGLITFYANGIIRWKEHGEMTLAEYKEYLAENPFALCYEMKEPIHYPLTAIDIKTLLGTNNIWSDTGDTSVTYRADTTLYISKKIAEAISALS